MWKVVLLVLFFCIVSGSLAEHSRHVKARNPWPRRSETTEEEIGDADTNHGRQRGKRQATTEQTYGKPSTDSADTTAQPAETTSSEPIEKTTTAQPICPWGDWQSWSKCDCRTGSQTRIRNPKHLPGRFCSSAGCTGNCTIEGCAGESRACRRLKCPIDCVYSKWSSWSECHGPCGDTIRRRHRSVRVPALYGGKKCKRFVEEKRCHDYNPQCSPIDCEVSEWSDWSECELNSPSSSCGECMYGNEYARSETGIQVRERTILKQGGGHCPRLQDSKSCHMICC